MLDVYHLCVPLLRNGRYLYPGKSRLEPLAIIVFACIMGMAAMQLIVEVRNVYSQPPSMSREARMLVFDAAGCLAALYTSNFSHPLPILLLPPSNSHLLPTLLLPPSYSYPNSPIPLLAPHFSHPSLLL